MKGEFFQYRKSGYQQAAFDKIVIQVIFLS